MSACHSEEITPDLCVSSITNVDASSAGKMIFLQSWRPGRIPLDVFTVADVQTHGKHLSPTVTQHGQLARELAAGGTLFHFRKP